MKCPECGSELKEIGLDFILNKIWSCPGCHYYKIMNGSE